MSSDACCSNPDVHCTRWCAECGTTLESGCSETALRAELDRLARKWEQHADLLTADRDRWQAENRKLRAENSHLRNYRGRRQAVADAGRALLRSNGADEDWEALRVALYELDGEPVSSDTDPAPVPTRVLLPAPDGVGPSDINTTRCAWWRIKSTREQILFAEPGQVYYLDAYTSTDLNAIEHDALVTLAAVHWARSRT